MRTKNWTSHLARWATWLPAVLVALVPEVSGFDSPDLQVHNEPMLTVYLDNNGAPPPPPPPPPTPHYCFHYLCKFGMQPTPRAAYTFDKVKVYRRSRGAIDFRVSITLVGTVPYEDS